MWFFIQKSRLKPKSVVIRFRVLEFVKNYEQRIPSEKLKVVKDRSQKKLKSEIKKSFLYAA